MSKIAPVVVRPGKLAGVVSEDPVIEMLRGFAACLVMATHYAYMLTDHPGGWGLASTGVDLFFVLSGYVFAPYLHGRHVAVVPHLVRRFFRLVPLYWFMLILYMLLRVAQGSPIKYFSEHIFFLQTLRSVDISAYYNPAFWSLPPEVEFYIALPLLALMAKRLRFSWILLLSIALHLVLVAAADPASQAVTPRAIATVHLPGLLCEFALGAMAWWCVHTAPGLLQRSLRFVLGIVVLGGLMMLYIAFVADTGVARGPVPHWVGGNIGLLAAFAYALLVSAIARGPGTALKVPGSRFWIWLGQCSYGLYLLHNATPQWLQLFGWNPHGWGGVMVCVLITLVGAWAANRLIESPLRTWGRSISNRLLSR